MDLTLRGARLVDSGQERTGDLGIAGGRIAPAGRGAVVDAVGAIVTPGFIDVHTHGGGGHSLQTQDAEEVRAYARWAPAGGTTAFLAGVVGVPGDLPEAQLRAATATTEPPAAEALGIHLEGPYLGPARRGAHDSAWLRLPEPAETERLLALTAGRLRLITLAPELPGADALLRAMRTAGVTVAVGHTDADYEQARVAFAAGATHVTHCFNGMRPLLQRAPGVIGALMEAETAQGELIADGIHVAPPVMRLLIRALGPKRTLIVSDAMPAAGVEATEQPALGRRSRVSGGVARLPDGTIAGSILTLAQGFRNVVALGVGLPEAVTMLSRNPARAAGVERRKGRLLPGFDADLLIWDVSLTLQAAICRGALAFATDSWRARLRAAAP